MQRDARLIVALDVDSYRAAAKLVKMLSPYVKIFKVGSILFTNCGPKIIKYIHKSNSCVFLDLKYNDIPNTVAGAAVEATKLGVYMLNVHALSGITAMKATAQSVAQEAKRLNIFKPLVVAVTVLTSLHDEDFTAIGMNEKVNGLVLKLASAAKESGLDGVVSSPHEIKSVKNLHGENFVVVAPGIRPEWAQDKADQKRIMTPKEAIANGADFIVVGRPILEARKPVKAVIKLLEEIQ